MSIPSYCHKMFFDSLGFHLAPGESENIKLLLDGNTYPAKLINQPFSRDKYAGHVDVLQIRYSENSDLVRTLREKFAITYDKVNRFRSFPENKNKLMKLDPSEKEFLILYATPVKGVLLLECITNTEFKEETSWIERISELDFETSVSQPTPISLERGMKKVRRLSRTLSATLKSLYGYRCQICGERIGEQYSSNLIYAHYIRYFTQSLDASPSNLMIVCPNHHAIIHDRNPVFDMKTKVFTYPNGFKEGLKLNLHL